MRRTLTLIRHGITGWNVEGRFQGHTDRPLSEAGIAQATRLASRVPSLGPVDLVTASPLSRAYDTAKLAFPGVDVVRDDRLMEIHFGAFEGRTLAENEAVPDWAAWSADPYGTRAPGGESYEDVRRRMAAWWGDLPAGARHVVAVTHSGSIQMMLAHVLGLERPAWRKRIYVRHTSISRIVGDGAETIVERVNDTRHLDEDGVDPFWGG